MNLNEVILIILIILCSLYSIINTFHIGVIKKNFIELNGIKIKSKDVHKYLHNHEKILLFGGNKNYQTDIKLVEVKRNKNQRKIRSTVTTTPSLVSVQIDDDNGKRIDLKLKQTSRLIDDAFILIKRYENSSQFIEDSHKLAIDYENCFYRNENSALDLCDDNAIRGLFRHNSKNFFIHPLPERFGNNSHIIYKSGNDYQNNDDDDDDEDIDDVEDHDHNDDNDYDNETNSNIINNINKKNLDKFNYKNKNKNFFDYIYDTNDNNEYFEPYNIENDYSDKIIIKNISKTKIKQNINECIHNENDKNNNNNNLLIKDNLKKSNLYKENNEKIFENEYFDDDDDDDKNDNDNNNNNEYKNLKNKYIRIKRHISKSKWDNIVPHVLHIETAIFVDRDLYKHMSKNFPKNTENHLIRFVLAMVNGVQLLYHHPSLGYQINFVLKRLEILYSDPKGLRRSSDIDIYLNNFCLWQKKLNPTSDADVVHYDHAVILTGLDLYVVGKNGKVSSQVVGLAPVAGMCTSTSSCTINEGKHFESVFVVAHEIGHNLGMRHDTLENNCDPSLYIMSPTLGSGKITWSKCSRDYLNEFLLTSQARCMFDRGQFGNSLDHSAEGILPGERFDADQQCMLKYGKDSVRSKNQPYTDICHDLHCQRERYTWTSHPALEGTECGEMMWCHSGVCIVKDAETEAYLPLKSVINLKHYDKIGSFIDDDKKLLSNLKHEYNFDKPPTWSEWGEPTNCESGCLYGSSGRLTEGSTGLKTFTRYCLGYKKRCVGRDHKYETCIAKQCYTITKTTVEEFATQICERAKKFDNDLSGEGLQIIGNDVEESCKVYCKTKMNTTKSRSWTYPDGTICYTKKYSINDISYCINGRCEKFSCNTTNANYFKINTDYCPKKNGIMITEETKQQWNGLYYQENGRDYKSIRLINRNNNNNNKDNKDVNKDNSNNNNNNNNNTKLYNEDYVNVKIDHINNDNSEINIKQESLKQLNEFQDRNYDLYETSRNFENIWTVKSGCHFSCVENAKGIQIVFSKKDGSKNIQLCSPKLMPCDKIQTTTEFAENICSKYKLKVRGLSGYGMQIQPSIQDPDRSCKVACQDEYLLHRFYLVNGDYGLFPFGTKCSPKEKRYCVNGKCLEFDFNDIPLMQSYISLALFRSKREVNNSRIKRSYLYYKPINITENITQDILDRIIHKIEFRFKETAVFNETISDENIQFSDPIHVSFDELVKF